MKNSPHNMKHRAKKAIRKAAMESESPKAQKLTKNYIDQYFNNLYASRPSVHKSALDHFIKETKRHKKMAGGKKHAKRCSTGQVNDDHPFTNIEHNPDYFIKHKQAQINEASHISNIKMRKRA